MSTVRITAQLRAVVPTLLLAGLVGGLAEVAWIGAYSVATSLAAGDVLRQIVASIIPALTGADFAPLLGLGFHLGLSALLGLAFGLAVWRPAVRRFGLRATPVLALVALAGVWALNFLVILPVLNPAFVELMPSFVTLASKLLFGAALAWTLGRYSVAPS